MTRGARALRLLHRKANCGVRRNLHESKLRHTGDEDEARLEGICWQRFFEKAAEHVFDLAQPAKAVAAIARAKARSRNARPEKAVFALDAAKASSKGCLFRNTAFKR